MNILTIFRKSKRSLPRFQISKRAMFVLSTLFLLLCLLGAYLLGINYQFYSVSILALLSLLVTFLSHRTEVKRGNVLIVLLLPMLFTISCVLLYFLLPPRWASRIAMMAIFSIGFYAIMLTNNIYLVSAIRNIKLLHAAHTIGFLLSVVCAFALYYVIYTLHTNFLIVLGLIGLSSGLLVTPIVWSIGLNPKLGKSDYLYIGILTLVISEVGTMITFWPVTPTFAAIFLTGNFYTFVGLCQHWLEDRLFKRVLYEFLWVVIALSIVLFITAHWGG